MVYGAILSNYEENYAIPDIGALSAMLPYSVAFGFDRCERTFIFNLPAPPSVAVAIHIHIRSLFE
jgi:hypothetical protein